MFISVQMYDDSNEVNGVEKRRRRAQMSMEEEPEKPSDLASDAVQERPEESSDKPRRRRRVQPPQQITQRIPRIVVPEETPIPRLPVIEEPKTKGKRYKSAEKKPGKAKPENRLVQEQRREKAEKAAKVCAGTGKRVLETVGGVLLLAVMLLSGAARKLGALGKALYARIADRLVQRTGLEHGGHRR